MIIDDIIDNILNQLLDDGFILMKSTINYFLFSFYNNIYDDIPTYVLVSKDYKKNLVAREIMECFDDVNFNEDERYGLYNYDYFFLNDNKVNYYNDFIKDYTYDYSSKFSNSYFYVNDIKISENYYDSLLNEKKYIKN